MAEAQSKSPTHDANVTPPQRRVFTYLPTEGIAGLIVIGGVGLELLRGARLGHAVPDGIMRWVFLIGMLICAGLALIGLLGALYMYPRRWLNIPRVQADRDRFAQELIPFIANRGERDKVKFGLYLRPFFTDKRFRLTGEGHTDIDAVRYGGAKTLETLIADAYDKVITLIAIGGDASQKGPGRVIATNDNWTSVFQLVAKEASIIFAVPFSQPATAWEVRELIASNQIQKVVFVVPPLKRWLWGKFRGQRVNNVGDLFHISRMEFADAGIAIPEMGEHGGLFRVGTDGSAQAVQFTAKEDFTPARFVLHAAALFKSPLLWPEPPRAAAGALDGPTHLNSLPHIPRWLIGLTLLAVVWGYIGFLLLRI